MQHWVWSDGDYPQQTVRKTSLHLLLVPDVLQSEHDNFHVSLTLQLYSELFEIVTPIQVHHLEALLHDPPDPILSNWCIELCGKVSGPVQTSSTNDTLLQRKKCSCHCEMSACMISCANSVLRKCANGDTVSHLNFSCQECTACQFTLYQTKL